MDLGLLDEILKLLFLFGAIAAVGFGIYLFVGGEVTNGLLAFILSCVAFNLSLRIAMITKGVS